MALSSSNDSKDIEYFIKKGVSAVITLTQFHKDFPVFQKEDTATILMVTHDAFTASYASRILFLKDGEIFMELRKGNDSRNAFFDKILNVLTIIGGGQSHVC